MEKNVDVVQKNRMLELLLDGYEVFWQAPENVVIVEDLNLVVHYLEKDMNIVETVVKDGVITIFKKRCA